MVKVLKWQISEKRTDLLKAECMQVTDHLTRKWILIEQSDTKNSIACGVHV